MTQFRTHTGELVKGKKLQAALQIVANDLRENAEALLDPKEYPPHVTKEAREDFYNQRIKWAESIELGLVESFTTWQRINTVLTGECVGFLPK